CGLQYPLGTRIPWFRSLTVNRGPVCDDRDLWRASLFELIQYMKKEGHIYLDAGPDWVNSSTSDMANPFEHSAWERISQIRYSLRVDLRKNEDALFAAFRKNTRYEIRRAERMGVDVRIPRSDADVHDFLQLYVRVA